MIKQRPVIPENLILSRKRQRKGGSGALRTGRYLVTMQNQHQPHITSGGKLRQNCDRVQTTGIWDFESWNQVQVVVL